MQQWYLLLKIERKSAPTIKTIPWCRKNPETIEKVKYIKAKTNATLDYEKREARREKEMKKKTFEKWKNYVVFFFADVIPSEKRENE